MNEWLDYSIKAKGVRVNTKWRKGSAFYWNFEGDAEKGEKIIGKPLTCLCWACILET